MRLFISILFLFCIFSMVYSTCSIAPVDSKSFNANYFIDDFGNVDAIFKFTFDYSKECMVNYSVDRGNIADQIGENQREIIIEVQNNEFSCPTRFKEMFYRQLDETFSDLFCFANFNTDEELSIILFGNMDLVSESKENFILSIGGWDFLDFVDNSSLNITKTGYSTFLDVSNRDDAILLENSIYFLKAPQDPILVSIRLFSLENEFSNRLFPIVVLTVFLVLFLAGFSLFFVWKKMPKKSDKKQELVLIKQKLKNLETGFMRGQMDENTYRRLSEQYNLQINELLTEIKKMEENKINIFSKNK